MAYKEELAERVRQLLQQKGLIIVEKKMMGGLCFMLNEKMLVGIVRDELMARIGPDRYEEALTEPGVNEMTFTGRSMRGYVFIQSVAIESDRSLNRYLDWCIDFNPLAKKSKKKAKKK